MPSEARAAITAQAQGIPLFAVETIRSLIDRDVVVPQDGIYRLVGDLGALSVPDSLHALLAARLDALDPELRALVADAAVVGTTFPAEALVAVSQQDESTVRRGLAELLRREVLEISADKLSPQRGSYRFAQNLLRQVAYDTLSRRDRKARHLAVAAHLRATFPGDGDEVIDAIARHYRDALDAVPDDPDAGEIRTQAVDALKRGAERASRSGSPRGAATSYATAAELLEQSGTRGFEEAAAALWEATAEAENVAGDYFAAAGHADHARVGYTAAGQSRAAARAQRIAGSALSGAGRNREAAQRLTAALEVLRPDPDRDTVRALGSLAGLYAFSAGTEADRLSAEALVLGRDLDLDDEEFARLFTARGLALSLANRPQEAIAHFEHAARLGERAGASEEQGAALLNLADSLLSIDPRAAAGAARKAWEHNRRVGARVMLSIAVGNLVSALILTGDWDEAEEALATTIEADGVDEDHIMVARGILAALRGDIETARRLSAAPELRVSEDPQDQSVSAIIDMLLAESHGDLTTTLDRAQAVVALEPVLSVRHEYFPWAWATATRVARELGDSATIERLLADLDAHPAGQLPALIRIERDLARARQAGDAEASGATTMFTTAIAAARRFGSPYHLAQGLLDQADYEVSRHDAGSSDRTDSAAPLIAEARQIAERLGARPLTERAERVERPTPVTIGTQP
jgi:tetratricopeptide (TPR) repeat protein